MAPLPLVAAAAKLWKSLTGDEKQRDKLASAVSDMFGAQDNLHISADDFTRPFDEICAHESAGVRRGGDGADAWAEWRFPQATRLEGATLSDARWRLHRSGLVIFNGVMRTTRGGLDRGDLLGHRIELATTDGVRLGVWLAGFFVRTASGVDRYVATAKISSDAVSLYFDALADTQSGQWFRNR